MTFAQFMVVELYITFVEFPTVIASGSRGFFFKSSSSVLSDIVNKIY
jgi:hypothetical protein